MNAITKKFLISVLLIFLVNIHTVKANNPKDFSIKGQVIDFAAKQPVLYANVLLFSEDTKEQINGIATKDEGYFELQGNSPGRFYLEVLIIMIL